jgi:hypothetical protein
MIDRLVHHADIVSLRGHSYRLKDKDLGGTTPTTDAPYQAPPELLRSPYRLGSAARAPTPGGSLFYRNQRVTFRPDLTATWRVEVYKLAYMRAKCSWRAAARASSSTDPSR